MRLKSLILSAGMLGLSIAGVAGANEYCQTLSYVAERQSAEQLRDIASQCDQAEAKNLYYYRAQHQELLNMNQMLQSLGHLGANQNNYSSLNNYRMYMAMVEMMAERTMDDKAKRAKLLNQEYAKLNDLYELRMKGFDHLADRMERNIYSN